MLSAKSLSYTLGANRILDNISLSLGQEDFISIVGPNGAGKTTLVRCLLGLLPFEGAVLLNEKDIRTCARKEIARSIAYVPQVVGLLPAVSVEQFVGVGRYAHKRSFFRSRPSDKNVIREALESTGCLDLRDRTVSSLSGGERQRILLAAALAQEPKMLILDEPTSFLDPRHETDLYRTLRNLHNQRGIGVCMINHDINSASNVSSRVLALSGGKLAFDGTTEEFMTEQVLGELYQTGFCIMTNPTSGLKSAVVKF